MNIRRPVPLWALLLTILVSGAVAATVVYFPRPPGPDFNLTLSLNPVIVQANNWNSTVVKVESVRGFVGVVTFGIIGPSGLSTELSLGQLGNDKNQLVLGAVGNLTLYTRSGTAADYSVRIVATGGPWVYREHNVAYECEGKLWHDWDIFEKSERVIGQHKPSDRRMPPWCILWVSSRHVCHFAVGTQQPDPSTGRISNSDSRSLSK